MSGPRTQLSIPGTRQSWAPGKAGGGGPSLQFCARLSHQRPGISPEAPKALCCCSVTKCLCQKHTRLPCPSLSPLSKALIKPSYLSSAPTLLLGKDRPETSSSLHLVSISSHTPVLNRTLSSLSFQKRKKKKKKNPQVSLGAPASSVDLEKGRVLGGRQCLTPPSR